MSSSDRRLKSSRETSYKHGMEAHVFVSGELLIQAGILENNSNGAADLRLLTGNVEAVDLSRASSWAEQRAEHIDGRGLARTVGAKESEDFALVHIKRDLIDGPKIVEIPDQFVDLDGVHVTDGVYHLGCTGVDCGVVYSNSRQGDQLFV